LIICAVVTTMMKKQKQHQQQRKRKRQNLVGWDDAWGPARRAGRTPDELALEALSGWEPTNCGAGVVRAPGTPVAVVHNIVSTSFVDGNSMPINLQRLAMYLPCSSYNRRRYGLWVPFLLQGQLAYLSI
jgi:hypothetical protein